MFYHFRAMDEILYAICFEELHRHSAMTVDSSSSTMSFAL